MLFSFTEILFLPQFSVPSRLVFCPSQIGVKIFLWQRVAFTGGLFPFMERCVVLKNHNDSNAFCSNNLVPNLIQKLEPVQVAFLIVRFRRKKAQEKHPSAKRKTMREAKVTKKGKGKTPKREGFKWDSRCMVEKPAGCVLDIFGHNFRLSTEVARSTLVSSHCCTQRSHRLTYWRSTWAWEACLQRSSSTRFLNPTVPKNVQNAGNFHLYTDFKSLRRFW